jgi:polyhydroxyalkanoate synthesis repressor PhaR
MGDTTKASSITIKKYANRRLYNTATSSYVTLENLAAMVKQGTEFNVYDAKTGEDLTRSVLTQIIVEEEGKSGQNLLPVSFLRQLIGFYGDSMQWMVPKYLEQSMQTLTTNQDQLRSYFQNTLGTIFPFGTTLEEMSKQNLAMFDKAMQLFAPFSPTTSTTTSSTATKTTAATATPAATTETKTEDKPANVVDYRSTPKGDDSTEEMQQKISNLQKQLAELAKKRG